LLAELNLEAEFGSYAGYTLGLWLPGMHSDKIRTFFIRFHCQ